MSETGLTSVSIPELISKYGSPLYIYDVEIMRKQYTKLKSAFKNFKNDLHFAVKALPNVSVLSFLRSLGAFVDTVSVEEIKLCMKAGFVQNQIIFTPSGPSEPDIDFALDQGIMITVDNLQSIEYIGQKYGSSRPISIRLNPEVLSGGDEKISVAGKQSKFGLAMGNVDKAKDLCKKYQLRVEGIHIHTGSDISSSSDYFQAVDNLVSVALTFENLKFVDLGSGFKIVYNPENEADKETNLDAYAEDILKRFNALKDKFKDEEFTMKFEPGKFIVSDSGYLITTATVVKNSNETDFVIVDSGLNHLIRPMMYSKAFHKITNHSNPQGEKKKYNVCGYICETDTFGTGRLLNEVRKGDHIVIHNAGAYCMSMASNYNCKCRPAEIIIQNGKDFLVRNRESFEDIIRHQILIDELK